MLMLMLGLLLLPLLLLQRSRCSEEWVVESRKEGLWSVSGLKQRAAGPCSEDGASSTEALDEARPSCRRVGMTGVKGRSETHPVKRQPSRFAAEC